MTLAPDRAPCALIAEDEPLLAAALRKQLAAAWPELVILETVGDGLSACTRALALQPDILFFDIAMPGKNGIDAAADIAEEWPSASGQPFPLLVFVTAFDDYACRAFDAEAVDYLLKPLQGVRLQKTVARLQAMLALRRAGSSLGAGASEQQRAGEFDTTLAQLRRLLDGSEPRRAAEPLQFIQAGITSAQGAAIRLVPIGEVLYLEAADKYVRVVTPEREYLVRTALKDLLPQLPAELFWRIHRGTVVRIAAVDTVLRSDSGRLHLTFPGRAEKLAVGRIYSHLFRAM